MTTQRDFLVEMEDCKQVTSVEMQTVVNRLPAAEMLSPQDVASALNVTVSTIYGLIQTGRMSALNVATTNRRPHYRLPRASVLRYIKECIQ